MGQGRGFGKTILIGDQFVLWGIPAILGAIPFETICKVEKIEKTALLTDEEKNRGWLIIDNRNEVPGYKKKKEQDSIASFNRMIDVMKIDTKKTPLKITVSGDLLAGSGVGASAAICVSFARACNEEFNLGMDNLEINYVAWEGEFGYHGLPSGLDNTVSTFGGIIEYSLINKVKKFERINISKPVEIVLANSGITANTAALKGFLEEQEKKAPELFKQRLGIIRDQVSALKATLTKEDFMKTGKIMNENHKILIEMGLSHPKLIELCNTANKLGAFGAKVTGGGRGGYMVALTPGKDLQNKVAEEFEKNGVAVIRASIGATANDNIKSMLLK